MNIAVIGAGYVGLVTAACFAKLGSKVFCIDNDRDKIQKLNKGIIPIFEPGLEELVKQNKKSGRIKFTTSIKDGIKDTDVVFICVGTPPTGDGDSDLSAVENVARVIAREMRGYKLIVGKSTVPVNTGEWIKHTVKLYNNANIEFDVASNPEFLREGTAIYDFLNPDRIVIGVESEKAKKLLLELYKPLDAPKLVTNIATAELIKHAANSFLATKISFINALSVICEKVGADVKQIANGMGYDKRIGRAFLDAGPGFGGACFPKDVSAFIKIAEKLEYDFSLLKDTAKINLEQRNFIVKKIQDALWIAKGKVIGVLGLSFKPNTDDTRGSPAIEIAKKLFDLGAHIKAYDPKAMEKAKIDAPKFQYCKNPYEVAKDSHALVVLTDWDEFKKLDLKKIKKLLKTPILIDARNIYEPKLMNEIGFIYKSVGRS
ncbi:MAG: UDP-glucose/GDP-mannose dehydrogenase family protein [Candidatus Firestonebacteria bacterium]